MATGRSVFNPDSDEFNPDAPEAPQPIAKKTRYSCKASGCPMVGAIGGHVHPTDPSKNVPGYCHHHWNTHTQEWGKLTNALFRLKPIIDEIIRGRWVMSDPAGKPAEQIKGHIAGASRLEGYLTPEQAQFMVDRADQSYTGWCYSLELMVQSAVYDEVRHDTDAADFRHPSNPAGRKARETINQAATYFPELGENGQ